MPSDRTGGGLFVGVDVGGTKIMAALVRRSGFVLARKRRSTPRDGSAGKVVDAIATLVEDLLDKASRTRLDIAAMGLAVAGVVDPAGGRVVDTPNMNLSGLDVVAALHEHIDVPIALGNDVNLGTLGEKWLGAARSAR